MKMKKIILLIICASTLSCAGLSDAKKVLKNEKIRTTDEFLVKKKDPLEMPPDYENLPEPDSLKKNKNVNEEEKLKKILNAKNQNDEKTTRSNSIEKSILNEINKK